MVQYHLPLDARPLVVDGGEPLLQLGVGGRRDTATDETTSIGGGGVHRKNRLQALLTLLRRLQKLIGVGGRRSCPAVLQQTPVN